MLLFLLGHMATSVTQPEFDCTVQCVENWCGANPNPNPGPKVWCGIC